SPERPSSSSATARLRIASAPSSDGADRRDAALPHHGRGHVGRGMQTVRRHCLGIELACEIERKHDLGELALRAVWLGLGECREQEPLQPTAPKVSPPLVGVGLRDARATITVELALYRERSYSFPTLSQ